MKQTQRDRILNALSSGRPVHMRTLNDICFRYGARIKELRDSGLVIETIRLGDGEFAYRLVKEGQLALV